MFFVPMTRETPQLSRLLDDTLERFCAPTVASEDSPARNPALDVAESEATYTVTLEVPGVSKEDIKVAIEGRQVSVQAQSAQTEERKDGQRLVYRERAVTRYSRSFTLPAEVDPSAAGARLDHGVLTLTLPKRGARSAAQITVN